MYYREWSATIVSLVTADHTESFCQIKAESQGILFIHIHPTTPKIFSEINQHGSISATPEAGINEKHFNAIPMQPDKSRQTIITAQSEEVDIRKILRNQGVPDFSYVFLGQEVMGSAD